MVVEDMGMDEIVHLEYKAWGLRVPGKRGPWSGEQQYFRIVGQSVLKGDWEGIDKKAREPGESNVHILMENERKRR